MNNWILMSKSWLIQHKTETFKCGKINQKSHQHCILCQSCIVFMTEQLKNVLKMKQLVNIISEQRQHEFKETSLLGEIRLKSTYFSTYSTSPLLWPWTIQRWKLTRYDKEMLKRYQGDHYSHHVYANAPVYTVLGHGLLLTLRRTGAIHNWYPTFTASPGVLQEITTDPITVCIQHALLNLCKSHNCSWFYNSWTRACSTGRTPASISQPPMSASSHWLLYMDKQ